MERQIVIGDMVMVIGKQFLYTSFGKTGQVMGLDENVQPGELFATVDMNGTEYCFNVKDLKLADGEF